MLISFLIFLLTSSAYAEWNSEVYLQSVHLYKFHDTIVQGHVRTSRNLGSYNLYGGVWFDQDNKTGKSEAYTDSQVSPLLGGSSQIFFERVLPSRAFAELRFVQRTVTFPDDRQHQDWEARTGLLGYDLIQTNSPFFFEHYYALFFTRLYDSRVLLQGWQRQGMRFFEHFDAFNEVMVDTFDQTRGRDGTLDLRPGLRWYWRGKKTSVQILHQYIYHFSNLNFSGRNEHRSTLVVGHQF